MLSLSYAEDLAKSYELEDATENGYFNYIVESLINGNRTQVWELFRQMHADDKIKFLNDFLLEDKSYHSSCRKICISYWPNV